MSNVSIGRSGEAIAKEYLIKNGYKILDTNKHFSKLCEIDIIAIEKKTLVFVEVKTRTSGICGSPLEAITKNKYNNIRQGLFLYLEENPRYKKYRIDAISIVLKPEIRIEHLKNISL